MNQPGPGNPLNTLPRTTEAGCNHSEDRGIMNLLLALRLEELTRPINLGITSPGDRNQILVALWQSRNAILTLDEVKSLCQTS